MNKSELIDAIAAKADISKAAAGKALDGMIDAVTDALKAGDTVTVVGFGTFYVGERAERSGRNPKTGEEVPISPRRVMTFKASNVLKQRILRAHIARKAKQKPANPAA